MGYVTKAKVVRRFPLKMVALYKCFVSLYQFSFLPKIPRVGIFYFASFSKNGRNHSGEWFDFEKKVLKTSIKSMHGQQTEK